MTDTCGAKSAQLVHALHLKCNLATKLDAHACKVSDLWLHRSTRKDAAAHVTECKA